MFQVLRTKLDFIDTIGGSFVCMGFAALLATASIQLQFPFVVTRFFVICIPVSIAVGVVSALIAVFMGLWRWLRPAEESCDEADDPLSQVPDRFFHLRDGLSAEDLARMASK